MILFAAKAAIIVGAILIIAAVLQALANRGRLRSGPGHLEVKKINQRWRAMTQILRRELDHKSDFRKFVKQDKQALKATTRADAEKRHRIFVLDFEGDLQASAVTSLREEVTAILTVATPQDEVMVRLKSAGGLVHHYGFAAAQLARFKPKKIPLTAAVDHVAASGGYMMAVVADRIIAAPFAVVGSIGVLAQLPNFHRWLKEHHVDFEQLTAGQYKRTLTLFGENTHEQRQKFQAEIDDTHALFKEFIRLHRPQVDLERVATGEHWYGARALELKLIDALITSDDFLLEASHQSDLVHVCYKPKKHLGEKINAFARAAQANLMFR